MARGLRPRSPPSEVNALELVQAYAKVELGDQRKGAKGGHGLLTLGRQTMDIGSRRLVARNRFRQTTNAFTGADLEWTTRGGARLQAFWTMPQIRRPDDAQGLRDNRITFDLETTRVQFFGAHATLPHVLGGTLEAYGFRLAEQDGDNRLTRNRRLWTTGARLFARPAAGKWDHDIEGAYQFGTARRSTAAADVTDSTSRRGFFMPKPATPSRRPGSRALPRCSMPRAAIAAGPDTIAGSTRCSARGASISGRPHSMAPCSEPIS